MRCPFCHSNDTQVRDSRPADSGYVVKRRRRCSSCGIRFTTSEQVNFREQWVVKKDGSRELFQKDKISRSVCIAFRKREINQEALDKIIADSVSLIEDLGKMEINTSDIGKIVLERLREIDIVAYIRFASVYREFQDLNDFKAIIDEVSPGEKDV